jgi:hypothetical protein
MESHSPEQKKSLWYVYFGKGGAAAFAFIWVILALFWIIYLLNNG